MADNKYKQPEQQEPVHGEQPDMDLANGPCQDRQCRDLICILFFTVATIAFITVLSIGFEQGHPERLSYAYDPDNRPCGQDPEVALAPYIYLVAPYYDHFNRSVCVTECPQWQEGDKAPTRLECITNSVVQSCNEKITFDGVNDLKNISSILDVDFENMDMDHLFNYSLFIYNSTPVFDRICLPSGEEYVAKLLEYVQGAGNVETFEKWVSDIELTYGIILASAAIAIMIGLAYLLLIRYCAGVLTWLAILLYFLALALLIYVVKNKQTYYQEKADANTANGISDADNEDMDTANGLLGLMICLIIIGVISLFGFICYFTRIRMAIAIIKTAALFVMDNPLIILVPPIITIILVGYWALWIVSFVYIYSIGEIKGSNDSPLATVTWDASVRYYLIYHLFYGLWGNAIISAFSCFVIASSCCIWFYETNNQLIHFPISTSIIRAFRYHFGSLIFGGLLLAIVQFVRFWLEYIHYQMKKVNGDKQQPLKCLLDCCRCYAACFERLISFLNKNAYIQIALTGKGFIVAAKNGFYLIWDNAGQFAVVSGIGGVFCTLCKLFIAFATTFFCYLIITESETYKDKLYSPILPSLLFFIISYQIGDLFMSVYGMAIDSVLQCSLTEQNICKRKGVVSKLIPQPIKEFLQDLQKK